MTLEEFDKILADAATQRTEGDWRMAARTLRLAAEAKGLSSDDERLSRMLELLSQIASDAGLAELAELSTGARDLEPQSLYDLAHQLVDVGLEPIGATLLIRVDQDVPDNPDVVTELAMILGQSNRHADARDLLVANPSVLTHLWPRYLLCLSAISALDLATARAEATFDEPKDESEAMAIAHIKGILDRIEEVRAAGFTLDETDLRGWHYAMNGSVLLHLSPYGFEEGMVGRYAYTQDSPEAIRRELGRLTEVLQQTGQVPTCLFVAPDRGSRIVGAALAQLLSVPLTDDASTEGALFVLYTSDRLDEGTGELIEALDRMPDFVRAVQWTAPPPGAPRYVGLLHQMLIAPWEEHMSVQPDGADVERVPASEEPDAVWVQRILDAEPDDDEPDPVAPVLALARMPGDPAERWQNGPVQSNQFI